MDINKFFEDMFKDNPSLKKQHDEDTQWRKGVEKAYIQQGIEKDAAAKMAWGDYWRNAKEKDGVEFSIFRID